MQNDKGSWWAITLNRYQHFENYKALFSMWKSNSKYYDINFFVLKTSLSIHLKLSKFDLKSNIFSVDRIINLQRTENCINASSASLQKLSDSFSDETSINFIINFYCTSTKTSNAILFPTFNVVEMKWSLNTVFRLMQKSPWYFNQSEQALRHFSNKYEMKQLFFFKNKGNNSTVQVYFQKKNSTNHIREVAHSNLKHLAPSYMYLKKKITKSNYYLIMKFQRICLMIYISNKVPWFLPIFLSTIF